MSLVVVGLLVLVGLVAGRSTASADVGVGPWAAVDVPTTNGLYQVAYGNSTYVAVTSPASGTSNQVWTSASGITWTPVTFPDTVYFESVTFVGGQFLVFGLLQSGGSLVAQSIDGVTWTSAPSPNQAGIWDVALANGLYVAVGGQPSMSGGPAFSYVMTSADGATWTMRTPGASEPWTNIEYGNGVFVAGTHVAGQPNPVMTSADGITWTSHAVDVPMGDLAYGNGVFAAVGATGSVMTSPDGIAWTSRPSADGRTWRSIEYGANMFVATTQSGADSVMTSTDAVTWTLRSAPAADWSGLAVGQGSMVAVAYTGPGRAMISYTPTVSAITPTSGPPGTPVTITGTHLGQATSVSFGATTASTFTSKSDTSVTVLAPPAAAGTVNVTVETPSGAVLSATQFTLEAAPVTPPAASVTPPAASVTPPAASVTPPAASVTPPAVPAVTQGPAAPGSTPVFTPPAGTTNPTVATRVAPGIVLSAQVNANKVAPRGLSTPPAATVKSAPVVQVGSSRILRVEVSGLPPRTLVTAFIVVAGQRVPLAALTTSRAGSLILPAIRIANPGIYNLGVELPSGSVRWIKAQVV